MNRRRVAALLRELADELERDDAEQPEPPPRPARIPRQKPGAEDHEKATRALRRAGVYPPRAWAK